MDELDWDWIGIGALILGGFAFLWGITNGKIKLELSQPHSIEERVARYPASAGAVIIKAQPRRAIWVWIPAGAVMVVMAFLVPYIQRDGIPLLCGRLTAAEAARWTLLLYFPVLPAALALVAFFEVVKAVRVLRSGYAPPLDAVVLHDTIAVTGWRAKLQGAMGLLVMPLAVGFVACLAYNTRQTFDESKMQTRIAARCSASAPAVTGSGS